MPVVLDGQRQPLLSKTSTSNTSPTRLAPPVPHDQSRSHRSDHLTSVHVPKLRASSPLARHHSASSSSSSSSENDSIWVKDPSDLDRYFEGPMVQDSYSRFPAFMRVQGSILPRMLVPLVCIALWTSAVIVLIQYEPAFAVSNTLMNTLGFVVALALSFRSTTAYERYGDGRRVWARILGESRKMARAIWLHCEERESYRSEDLLGKVTSVNLLLAFAIALKHRLRFEPHTQYADLADLIGHLHTTAHAAFTTSHTPSSSSIPTSAFSQQNNEAADLSTIHPPKSHFARLSAYLGVPFFVPNPRRALYLTPHPIGNLPLEILSHLSLWTVSVSPSPYSSSLSSTSTHPTPAIPRLHPSLGLPVLTSGINALTDLASEADRILNTPLPLAYSIAFSQITYLYVYALPFQLYASLGWLTLPGTVLAAYVIMGIAAIGLELENPFGRDTNDLDLDGFCAELAGELDCLMAGDLRATHGRTSEGGTLGEHSTTISASTKQSCSAERISSARSSGVFVESEANLLLSPVSRRGYQSWLVREEDEVRSALRARALLRGRQVGVRGKGNWWGKRRVVGRELTV